MSLSALDCGYDMSGCLSSYLDLPKMDYNLEVPSMVDCNLGVTSMMDCNLGVTPVMECNLGVTPVMDCNMK